MCYSGKCRYENFRSGECTLFSWRLPNDAICVIAEKEEEECFEESQEEYEYEYK